MIVTPYKVYILVTKPAVCIVAAKSEKAAPAGIDYSKELSDELSALLGRKVRLLDGKRTGRIEIEFYGADDREVLISQLRNIK